MSDSLRTKVILGFACIYIIWGSTYLAIRFGVETIPPFLLAGFRFLVGGILFYLWAMYRKVPAPKKAHWIPAIIIGALLAAGGNGLVTWAEMTVPSGIAALLVAMVPLFIVMIDWLRPKGTRPSWVVMAGVLLGFVGVAFLINPALIGGIPEFDTTGTLIVVLAGFFWAIGSVYSRYAPQSVSQIQFAGMQMIGGGAVALLIGIFSGELSQLDLGAITAKSFLSWVYLTTVGSFAYVVYIWLLKASTPARVATYAYVNPVIALLLGAALAEEKLSLWTGGCSVVIVLAVAIIITAKARAQKIIIDKDKLSDPSVTSIAPTPADS